MKDVLGPYSFWLAPEKIIIPSYHEFPEADFISVSFYQKCNTSSHSCKPNGLNDFRNCYISTAEVGLASAQCSCSSLVFFYHK